MDTNFILAIIIGLLSISFIIWIIRRELYLEIETVKVEQFIGNWIKRRFIKGKNEILIESGIPCIKIMNKSAAILRQTLELNPELKIKIIVGSKISLAKHGKEICKVLTEPGIIERIELREMDQELNPVQHYILIDGRDMLLAQMGAKGKAFSVTSLIKNKDKVKQFRDQFEELWKNLKEINPKTLNDLKEKL